MVLITENPRHNTKKIFTMRSISLQKMLVIPLSVVYFLRGLSYFH